MFNWIKYALIIGYFRTWSNIFIAIPPFSFNAHLGESAVGKSSLVTRFAKGAFSEYQESTIGAQSVNLDGQVVRFEIWDTAGQERKALYFKLRLPQPGTRLQQTMPQKTIYYSLKPLLRLLQISIHTHRHHVIFLILAKKMPALNANDKQGVNITPNEPRPEETTTKCC
ncbi:LOW QUALITY PROTEIN: hypothetical protein MXB_1513 [Myxobolus squamalis]|nr:LOW QUALITY PROTEIN: hypothetical protein MXB_1513 [Myxobolus squamalis]